MQKNNRCSNDSPYGNSNRLLLFAGNWEFRFRHSNSHPHELIVSGGLRKLSTLPNDKMCRVLVKNLVMMAPNHNRTGWYHSCGVDLLLKFADAKLGVEFLLELVNNQRYTQLEYIYFLISIPMHRVSYFLKHLMPGCHSGAPIYSSCRNEKAGDDMTDCSFIFPYILCTMIIRQNLEKVLVFAPSRAMNRQQGCGLFGAPQQQDQLISVWRVLVDAKSSPNIVVDSKRQKADSRHIGSFPFLESKSTCHWRIFTAVSTSNSEGQPLVAIACFKAEMPAAELQLVQALSERLGGNGGNVAVVSCEKSKASFSSSFPNHFNVSYHNDLAALSTLSNLDGLIVNKILSTESIEDGKLDTFVASALSALKTSGVCVIRDDLNHYNDAKKVAKLTDYFDVFRTENDGKTLGFLFYAVSPVEAAIYADKNWNDVFWTLVKNEFPPRKDANVTFRDFLDKTQYTDTGIYAYEWIFGDDFISPGGWPENLRILKRYETLSPGQTMLDIGVGIGGGARQAASEFGLHVTGIDLSSNMLAVALARNHRDKDARVKYMITDAMIYEFPEDHFDYVFSRDCIQHIEDTQALFNRIYKCLRPGGKVLITMYGVGYGKLSAKFEDYVAQRAYFLKNRDQIQQFAKNSGFENIVVENMTDRFKEILGEERGRVENNKQEFLSKFSQKEYDSLVVGWNNKLGYIADDNHNWNLFIATKPKRH